MKKRYTITGGRPARDDLLFEQDTGVRHLIGMFNTIAVLCGEIATTEHYKPLRGDVVPTCLLCIARAG